MITHPHTHTRTHALTHTLTHSLTHSHSHSLTHSLPHSPTYSLTHTVTHALTPSFTHSRPHALTHSLTHSLTYLGYARLTKDNTSATGRVRVATSTSYEHHPFLPPGGVEPLSSHASLPTISPSYHGEYAVMVSIHPFLLAAHLSPYS